MKEWDPQLKLLAVLAATKELLLRSDREGWPDEDPQEVAEEVGQVIAHVLEPAKNSLPQHARALFAATGPIQELALSNGWHEEYMALASEFDTLQHLLFGEE